MATVNQVARKQRIGIIQQSRVTNHWAAPAAASALFAMQPYYVGQTRVSSGAAMQEFNYATGGAGLMKEAVRRKNDQFNALPSVPFQGVVTKQNLAAHLVAFFQSLTEAATTPYAKVIIPADAKLDFATNVGYLWSVATGTYDSGSAGDGMILENALLNTLVLTIDQNAKGTQRVAQISGDWKGNNLQVAQHFTGTWTDAFYAATPTFLNDTADVFTVDLTIDGTTFTGLTCWRKFVMNGNNNVSSDCFTTGGKANNYVLAPSITYELTIPYTDASYVIRKACHNGGNVDLNIYNGAGTTDGQLNIDFPSGYLTKDPEDFDGDYHAFTLSVEVDKLSTGWANNVKFTDTIDGGY